jgi:hypothetical protein
MSIVAKCGCGKSFKAKPELAGRRVKCPACGQAIQIPDAQPVPAASESPSSTIAVTCQCGQSFKAPEKLAGKQVACPACKNPLSIPLPQLAANDPLDAQVVDALGNFGDPLAGGAPVEAAGMPMPVHAPTGVPAKKTGSSNTKIILYILLGIGGVIFLGCAGLFMLGFAGGFRQVAERAREQGEAQRQADLESAYGPGYSEDAGLMDFGVTGHQLFGDFSADVPEGWVSVTPQPGKTKALMVIGTNPDFAGVMLVDVGPPVQPTAQATAEEFAKENSGQVSPDAVALDGVDGVRVTTSSTSTEAPREIIIVHRNSTVYLLMGAGLESIDVTSAVERVRSTWKWEN